MKLKITFLTLILISVTFIYSCKDNSVDTTDDNPPVTTGGIVLENNTRYFDATALNNISSITTNKITFSSNPGLNTGSIIISGKSSNAPKGLLRKVTSVSSDGLSVNTVLASLDDAIKSGKISINSSLSKEVILPKLLVPGSIEKIKNNELLTYSIDAVLYDIDGNLNTTNDQLRLNGDIGISLSLGGEIEFSPLTADLSLNVTGEANVELIAKTSFNRNQTFNIFEKQLNTYISATVPPVVITPVFQVYMKVEANNSGQVSANIRDRAVFTSSISYNGSWNFEKNFTNTFTFEGVNAQLNSNLKGTLGTKLSFILYEIAGPSVVLEPYLELNVNTNQTPWWNLYAGADGLFGIKTGWLGFGILEKSWTFYTARKLIASAQTQSNLPPSAILNVTPTSGTTSTVFEFSALSSIDDHTPQSQLKVRWDWESDGNWDTQFSTNKLENHQFSFANYYTVALEVMDEEGLTDTTTRHVNVTSGSANQPPNLPSNPYPSAGAQNIQSPVIATWDCSDPDGDLLNYSIEAEIVGDISIRVNNILQSSYNLGSFTGNKQILWRVIAFDSHGDSIRGDLWNFWTGSGSGNTGTFTDPRDGKIYNTVKIGDQWWFAENLDYASPNSVYYNDDQNIYSEYGRLYNREEATQYCPLGWHLPSQQELDILVTYLGGENVAGGKLKETGFVHWKYRDPPTATNETGFTAFGGGAYWGNTIFLGIKEVGNFYGGIEGTNSNVTFSLQYDDTQINFGVSADNIVKFSVRPIKDN